jgi:uncharacterized protein (TIGR03546 family)
MEFLEYFRPIRNLLRVFGRDRSPHQLALAIAIGMMIGLIPKGNLIAVIFSVALLALRVNLGAGLTVAFAVSMFSPQLDRLTHGVGVRLLKMPAFHEQMVQIYQWPVVAWSSLNNTAVLGGVITGSLLFYPTYHISRGLICRWLPVWQRIHDRWKKARRRAKHGPTTAEPVPAAMGSER